MALNEIILSIENIEPIELFGVQNAKLSLMRKAFPRLKIVPRGDNIKIAGSNEDMEKFKNKLNLLIEYYNKHGQINDRAMETILMDVPPETLDLPELAEDILVFGNRGLIIKAKTENQQKMVNESEKNDILFAIGPAGTGKTYTAVALAVRALKSKQVKKIVLTRPAVEAGENLGFLPGDLKEKVDPYLIPLYDALDDMLPVEKLNYYLTNRIIEIAPLAFMRGRTLDHSFIILDEAQNATDAQLKMFLTRLGPNAKSIITGDLTQIDLPRKRQSGLFNTINILNEIEGIAQITLAEKDIIRHKLVKKIISAFDKDEKRKEEEREKAKKASKYNQ
ncbi:MAG: PhoH family protein [Chitinophagaceae bacterium]|nr:MAG: PhoH family protein [Chitinophagaceae bacterium]